MPFFNCVRPSTCCMLMYNIYYYQEQQNINVEYLYTIGISTFYFQSKQTKFNI